MKWLLTIAFALGLTAQASAADRCMVTDPTGTELKVRSAPAGKTILTTLPNGVTVDVTGYADDAAGKTWARIAAVKGHPKAEGGWVIREFVSCF